MESGLYPYRIIRRLEKSSFGTVSEGYHELLSLRVAIKSIDNSILRVARNKAQIMNELRLIDRLRHPHVIGLIDVVETSSTFYVVMEYAEQGDLFNLVAKSGALDEPQAREFFRQLVCGVEFLHASGLAHLNLKLENLLVGSGGRLKLTGLGLAQPLGPEPLASQGGSLRYLDPDRLRKSGFSGEAADVWSLGVILFNLLAGRKPFDDELQSRVLLKASRRDFDLPSNLSPDAREFISALLEPSSARRLSLSELKIHPWFTREELGPIFDSLLSRQKNGSDRLPVSQPTELLLGSSSLDPLRPAVAKRVSLFGYDVSPTPSPPYEFNFRRLEYLVSIPEKVEALESLNRQLLARQSATLVDPWLLGLRLPPGPRQLTPALRRLLTTRGLAVRRCPAARNRLLLVAPSAANRPERVLAVQLFADEDRVVLQLRNESFPVCEFVDLAKQLWLAFVVPQKP